MLWFFYKKKTIFYKRVHNTPNIVLIKYNKTQSNPIQNTPKLV